MNKRLILPVLLTGVLMLVLACTGKKEESTHNHEALAAESWKEMDDFHMVMAEAFHPYKDSMNLEPAKAKAAEMAESAAKWFAAPLPEKVNNDGVKAKLDVLKNETEVFVETAAKGDDAVTAEALTKLHDLFHELQETWYGGHGEHHH